MKLVVHRLIDKRAETAGKIEAQRDQLAWTIWTVAFSAIRMSETA